MLSSSLDYQEDPGPLAARNKRRNTALSCAECRRLKLRCSRNFPCSNCVKKGCAAICPEGSLTTGKGNRFVLANTEVLHEKIAQLCDRVRQLEDGLAQAQSSLSRDRHPLLSDELLQIKRPLERDGRTGASPPPQPAAPEADDATDAIGSLSISESGRSSFYGTTANSWYLLQNEALEEQDENTDADFPVANDVSWLSHAFPFASTSRTAHDMRGTVFGFLPSFAVAQAKAKIYYRQAAFIHMPIPEAEFEQRILYRIYNEDASPTLESVDSHTIAVLYMVLATGTLVDYDSPPRSEEAMQYYQLGRAALSLDSVLEEQSITAIQALVLTCHFMFLADINSPRWVIMGIAVKIAQSIGLHRDSGRWKVDDEETQRRRHVFWELYSYDSWQSLTFGRPPSFSMMHVDVPMAYDTVKKESGEVEMSYFAWKHRFASLCQSEVHDRAFGARPLPYKTIIELDKKTKEFYIPPSLQVPGFGGSKVGIDAQVEQPPIELVMQRYVAWAMREITIFYMHRGFFARAIEENPEDPLGNKYAQSVLAAYTTACSYVGLVESMHSQYPILTERMWFLFTHVFSCAIVLGSIATKSRMTIAPSALSHLDSAYNLFNRVSENPNAAKILPILQRLKDRARESQQPVPRLTSSSVSRVKSESDEFSALGGSARLVSRKSSSSPASSPPNTGLSPPSHHSPSVVHSPPPPPIHNSIPTHMPSTQMPGQYEPDPSLTAWHDYGHVQTFNYPPSYPQNPAAHVMPEYPDASQVPLYPGSSMPSIPPMDSSGQYYYGAGFETYGQSQGYQYQGQGDGMAAPAVPDLSAAWYSLASQYNA